MEFNTRLVWITPDAEKNILHCARVSNPKNQDSTSTKLIHYLLREGHWSPFEMANACFEIETSRAISAQILRHRSFSFQEFSQRYAEVPNFVTYEARRQDPKNRQNSIDDMLPGKKVMFENMQDSIHKISKSFYKDALDMGIAKEQARMLLPMSSSTKIYMNGTIRSWIHYVNLRTCNGTQKEHMEIAQSIKDTLSQEMPVIAEALEWNK